MYVAFWSHFNGNLAEQIDKLIFNLPICNDKTAPLSTLVSLKQHLCYAVAKSLRNVKEFIFFNLLCQLIDRYNVLKVYKTNVSVQIG